ncbi:dihydrofolate reductase [Frigidibacter sp. MR17.14]|uniref:dihydrofolate reductase n=1 Tax=Frigidibacter sp. MR17.14 TaxID=3126509 RepID=UPI003012E798
MLTIVVARARNGAIGRGNTIPWHVPQDLKAFKRETLGGALIMGRRTWDSLPVKPLKDRLNLVVSRTLPGSELVVPSVPEAISRARVEGYDRIYAIGGAAIYAEALGLADRILVTEVDTVVEDADAFFPPFAQGDWRQIGSRPLDGAAPACVVEEYLRRGT